MSYKIWLQQKKLHVLTELQVVTRLLFEYFSRDIKHINKHDYDIITTLKTLHILS